MQQSHNHKPTEHEQQAHNQRAHNRQVGLATSGKKRLFQWHQRQPAEGKAGIRTLHLPSHLPKWWPYGLVGLGVAGAITLAFRPAPIAVDLATVQRGPLQVTIAAEGKTRVQDRFVVAAPVDGRLQRITVEVGDQVEAGEIIAQLDPLPLNSQVAAAQARLQALQAQMAGVETQRPKSQELVQAEARLRSAEAAQQAATAQVAQAETQWEQAKRDRDRATQLERQGALSRRDLETAQTLEATKSRELEAARQQLNQSIQSVTAAREDIPLLQQQQRDPDYLITAYRADMAAVEAELENLADAANRTTIKAPAAGTILRLPEASARFVQSGEPLVEIGAADDLELVIDVLSTDAVKIKPGNEITLYQWGGSEDLQATVSAVEPAAFTKISALGVEEQRVNVIAQFSDLGVPPNLSLGDGYRVEADIIIWQTEDSLQVPVSALFRCDVDWCVFTTEGNRARQQRVEIGRKNAFNTVINTGLMPGENVILYPNEKIEAGSKIKPR
ncbi:MAG: HlyD family efflux transporter periplasmic adaptor subunit [Cyanobacteria bacterium J06621_3]